MSAAMEARPGRLKLATSWFRQMRDGIVVAATIAFAASFLAEHYGGSAMLFALLLGMAFNFLTENPRTEPGIAFSSRTLLRIGVALLGVRLTWEDVSRLGAAPMIGVAGLLMLTLAGGIGIALAFRRPLAFGLLTGGAVAICGASAALAIAAMLPRRHVREQDVLFTVVGVTALSTVAMVVYPVLFKALGLSDIQAGYLVGATIHDVAQVVGAGYSIGDEAGDIATFTKLLRVALLPGVLLVVGLCFRSETGGAVRLPWFVVAFMALMVLGNLVTLPEPLLAAVNEGSRFALVMAISALGVRTSLQEMFAQGSQGFVVIGLETLMLLVAALALVRFVVF